MGLLGRGDAIRARCLTNLETLDDPLTSEGLVNFSSLAGAYLYAQLSHIHTS
jgi:hypothetical protein